MWLNTDDAFRLQDDPASATCGVDSKGELMRVLGIAGSGVAIVASLLLLFGTGLSGCNTVDESAKTINGAADTIDRQPDQWRVTLSGLIAQLGRERSDALDQVQKILDSAMGQSENVGFCTVDFIGRRVSQNLRALAHKIDSSQPEPEIVPVVCRTSPGEQVDAGKTLIVTYYGYDFLRFENQAHFIAELRYADGTQAGPVPFGNVDVAHNYQLSVEFQAEKFQGVNAARGPKLVLTWNNDAVSTDPGGRSELPVILPPVHQPKTSLESWRVQYHVGSQLKQHCDSFKMTYPLAPEWMVDRSQGDPGHAGMKMTWVGGNRQANDTLRSFNYGVNENHSVKVEGEICAARRWGAGAIFDRVFRIYLIEDPTAAASN